MLFDFRFFRRRFSVPRRFLARFALLLPGLLAPARYLNRSGRAPQTRVALLFSLRLHIPISLLGRNAHGSSWRLAQGGIPNIFLRIGTFRAWYVLRHITDSSEGRLLSGTRWFFVRGNSPLSGLRSVSAVALGDDGACRCESCTIGPRVRCSSSVYG